MLVCTDNQRIKDRLTASKNIRVNVVPSLLIIDGNKNVFKYEGDDVAKWIEQSLPQPETASTGSGVTPLESLAPSKHLSGGTTELHLPPSEEDTEDHSVRSSFESRHVTQIEKGAGHEELKTSTLKDETTIEEPEGFSSGIPSSSNPVRSSLLMEKTDEVPTSDAPSRTKAETKKSKGTRDKAERLMKERESIDEPPPPRVVARPVVKQPTSSVKLIKPTGKK